jgi:hypothetical protein
MDDIAEDKAFEKRTLAVIEESETLVKDAEERITEVEKLYKEINLDPDGCRRFLAGDQLTGELKEQARKELQAFMDEVERDRQRAVELAKSRARKPPKVSAEKIQV